MKITLLLAFISVAAAFTDVPSDQAFYDNFLKNTTAVKNFFGCMLDENPCDEFGSHAKRHFDEILKGTKGCEGCNPVQKHVAHVIDQIIQQGEYKAYFDEFRTKFDPEGKYFEQLEESVKDY